MHDTGTVIPEPNNDRGRIIWRELTGINSFHGQDVFAIRDKL